MHDVILCIVIIAANQNMKQRRKVALKDAGQFFHGNAFTVYIVTMFNFLLTASGTSYLLYQTDHLQALLPSKPASLTIIAPFCV